jgi:hypothetical protein
MVNVKVNQTIRVNIAVWDFCGQVSNGIYISNVGIDTIPELDTIVSCQDITGLAIGFKLVTSEYIACKDCTPEVVYATWGTAYTDSLGYAYLDYRITPDDLAAYQLAISAGATVKVLACITGAKGQQVINNMCSEPLTVLEAAAPTHYVSLSMGFVPLELISYFETYISAISDNLMTYIAPLPSPWEYVKTTYDRITNSFNIWLYLPATAVLSMSPGALQDIYDFFTAWAPLVTGILLILIASFGPFGLLIDLVLLFAGLAILAWKVIDATLNQILAETIATNLTIQLGQINKETQARNAAEELWNKSAKAQSDCITRLQSHRSIHLAKLNGYLDQYAKYPDLVTELNKEKETFTANASSIINEFQTVPYVASVCDTYFVRLNSEIGRSDVAINDSLGKYIKPDETYLIACKGWTNQAACEKGECFWYDSACHKEENCWIGSPLGGCVLSAGTGKTIVGVTAGLILLGATYWLFTRKRAEVSSIYIGAREAVTTEAARAKAAYSSIRAPSVPAAARVIARAPVIPY